MNTSERGTGAVEAVATRPHTWGVRAGAHGGLCNQAPAAMARRAVLGLACLMLLTACASPQLKIPETVKVAVPAPCIDPEELPQRPPLASDAELQLMDSYHWALALWRDRSVRQGYEAQLEAVANGCSKIPALAP